MRISPPVAVLAILALGVAAATWLAPLPRMAATVSVILPVATHQKLARWGQGHQGADGTALSVTEVIEVLAAQLPPADGLPPNVAGTHSK